MQNTEASPIQPKTTVIAEGADLLPKMPEPTPPKTISDAYNQWAIDQSPTSMHATVEMLRPAIDYKLAALGVADNPQMRHQARLMAAEAVRKYNPNVGVSLPTWTQQHLQGMNRFKRENQGPVRVPDRAALDAWTLEKAQQALEDELGHEPDVKQLADRTNLSLKRIADVRRTTRPVAAASQMYDEGGANPIDHLSEALDYVYDDSDYVDRKLIEYTTGYGGTAVLSKHQAAAKLGISPAQATRRTERIALKLQDLERDMETTF